MTHFILIQPDQTFSYQQIMQPADRILQDIQADGKLPDYIKADDTARNPVVNYSALLWQEWVIVLPAAPENTSINRLSSENRLTYRQLDVLHSLSQGMTGKQIAVRLNISRRSVSLHISALKRNLKANTTAECVQKAARLGILKPGG